MFGVGDGSFGQPTFLAVGIFPSSVSTGDFNADGFTDLITTNAIL